MRILKTILLTSFLVCLLLISNASKASVVIGTTATINAGEKYSLKNLSTLSHRTATFSTLRFSLDFKGFANTNNNPILNASNEAYLKYNKGNISYVIPYKYKIILPRFKTPSNNN
jgi:hypothetical protein